MSASILLLDPYRSALTYRGINEKVLSPPKSVNVSNTPTKWVGNDADLQATVLQFVTLFDQVFLVHHENRGDAERYQDRVPALSLMPFEDMGIVAFTKDPGNDERADAWKSAQSVEEIWALEKDNLTTWETFLIPTMLMKGTVPDASIYHFLRAVRLGDDSLKQETEKKIPPQFSDWIPYIIYPEGNSYLNLDFVIFSTLNEIMETEDVVKKRQCRVAHMAFNESFLKRDGDTAKGTSKVFEVLIEQLLQERFLFPVPETLKEVQSLRVNPDVVAFRNTFQPWVETLSKGNVDDERRLRKEVKSAIKVFEKAPKVRRINKFLTYIAMPVGFIPFTPLVGGAVGALAGLTGIGLDKLAARWQQKGNWVGMCRKSDKLLNLDYPDFD